MHEFETLVNGYSLVITIKKEKLKRVAVISSRVLLRNHTNMSLEYALHGTDGMFERREIKNDKELYPIIFDKVGQQLSLAFKSSVSEKIDLKSLLGRPSCLIQCDLVCAQEKFNHLFIQTVTKGLVVVINIEPALKLYNFTPSPIEFQIRCKSRQGKPSQSEEGMVYRGKPSELYRFDPYRNSSVLTLTLNDVYHAELNLSELLVNESTAKVDLSRLGSKDSSYGKITLELLSDRRNRSLTIFSKFNILNETGLPLDLLSLPDSNPGKSMPLIANADQTVFYQAKKSHDTFVVKPNSRTFQAFPDIDARQHENSCFFPKKINHVLKQKLTGGVDKSFYLFSLTLIPNVMKLGEGVVTKTITICPKYVFVNETVYKLCLIQQECTQMSKVRPGERLSMIWRGPKKMCSFQIVDLQEE